MLSYFTKAWLSEIQWCTSRGAWGFIPGVKDKPYFSAGKNLKKKTGQYSWAKTAQPVKKFPNAYENIQFLWDLFVAVDTIRLFKWVSPSFVGIDIYEIAREYYLNNETGLNIFYRYICSLAPFKVARKARTCVTREVIWDGDPSQKSFFEPYQLPAIINLFCVMFLTTQ